MFQLIKKIKIILSYFKGLLLSLILLLRPLNKLQSRTGTSQLIVSVTSYGRRVRKTLKFAVLSMLAQSIRPDRIIIWLDEEHFNSDNIPTSIRRLVNRYGVEVKFCPDYKSYKKLIPTLSLCPEDLIVTIDDDLIYDKRTIEMLYNTHLSNPNAIVCSQANIPTFVNGHLRPYNDWVFNVVETDKQIILPLGGSGTLYPPNSLFKDVNKSSLFMTLSPCADDVWFWIMGIMQGTTVKLSSNRHMIMPIDLLYQLLHKNNNSLMRKNLAEGYNDVQIKAVFSYYGLSTDEMSIKELIKR